MENLVKRVHQNKQFCTGCGVCAGLCKAIHMETDIMGQYSPVVDTNKCVDCGRCVSVCPVLASVEKTSELSENLWGDKGLSFYNECGYYLATYEGADDKLRKTGASGGYCTALLQELLNRDMVDAVYCAWKTDDWSTLYSSKRLTTCEELRMAQGSAYYPIEISETIKSIREHNERVAIVCLPCQATALRMAIKKDAVLRKSIFYIIGLVCGGLPGKSMVEYIARDLGCEPSTIRHISFREKDEGIKCNNVQIKIYTDNKTYTSRFHNGESFGFVYLNHILHNPVCNVCTDVFAEHADIVFGDAWFENLKDDEYGTSTCIVRNSELNEIMKEIANPGDIERAILSQKNVGVLNQKKKESYWYKKYYSSHGYSFGNTVKKFKSLKDCLRYIRLCIAINIFERNRELWRQYKMGKINFEIMKQKWTTGIKFKRRMYK